MAKKKTETANEAPTKKAVAAKKPVEKTTKSATKKEKSPAVATDTEQSPHIMKSVEPYSLLTDFDIGLFKAGKHYKLYEKLGSHVVEYSGVGGTFFGVLAPNAHYVSVI